MKTIKIALFIAMFLVAGHAYAALPTGGVCNTGEKAVYIEDYKGVNVLVNCLKQENIAKDAAQAAERTLLSSVKLPVIAQKTVITDGKGHYDFCPAFFPTSCVISNSAYHTISMTWEELHKYFPFVNKF